MIVSGCNFSTWRNSEINYFFTLQPFSYRHKVASLSLLYQYAHGKSSDKLQSLVTLVQTFTAKTQCAIYTEEDHSHSFYIPLVRRKFHSGCFFPRATTLRNRCLRGCCCKLYNLDSSNLSSTDTYCRILIICTYFILYL